ncbi:GNAT family N-acetyltransferase [Pseudoalteromonas phenolica]|uniref:GNAT family N-acetyltransferase n=1 Tax=Pseudoalteromonas phenolica TaxID=161398 RepID=UPI000FFE748E|nr:GNAT family N-acetyltransferase [Pseudoalteromonas phenolica]RXF02630.1 N-acetyltransferase [Pseudoalteromonas phenolica O-BC30]
MLLTTDRLLLREATLNDASFIYRLLNQESFKQNIADKHIKDLNDAVNYINTAFLTPYRLNTFSPYIVCLKNSQKNFAQIGVCGLYKRPALNYPDLGYAFLDEFTGYGFATEAAKEFIQYSSNALKLKHLCALTEPNNNPSINLLKKMRIQIQNSNQIK